MEAKIISLDIAIAEANFFL